MSHVGAPEDDRRADGTNGGKVYFIDESAHNIFKTYDFGGVAITGMACDANSGKMVIATATGELYYIDFETDPT